MISRRDAPAVHLICGLPCAGKTTYAAALRADKDCVLFTLDQWLISLFGQYSIRAIGHEEHTRRVLACRGLIWQSAAEFLRRSVDVVLDDGFFLRANRVHYVELARGVNAAAKIHFLNTPETQIRRRLIRRNAQLPAYNFYIDPESLETFISLFETPSADEGAQIVVLNSFEAPRTIEDEQDGAH